MWVPLNGWSCGHTVAQYIRWIVIEQQDPNFLDDLVHYMSVMKDIIVDYVNEKRQDETDIQIEDIEAPATSTSTNEQPKEDLSGNIDGFQWSNDQFDDDQSPAQTYASCNEDQLPMSITKSSSHDDDLVADGKAVVGHDSDSQESDPVSDSDHDSSHSDDSDSSSSDSEDSDSDSDDIPRGKIFRTEALEVDKHQMRSWKVVGSKKGCSNQILPSHTSTWGHMSKFLKRKEHWKKHHKMMLNRLRAYTITEEQLRRLLDQARVDDGNMDHPLNHCFTFNEWEDLNHGEVSHNQPKRATTDLIWRALITAGIPRSKWKALCVCE
jgi:hypothetical protein